jgi:hypothetical protein
MAKKETCIFFGFKVTSWNRVHLEKPPVVELLKNFTCSLQFSQEPSTYPYSEPD